MKMDLRMAAAGLFVLFAAGQVSPAEAAKYKIRWLIGHPNLDYFEEAAEEFKKTVETGSKGDIAVEIVTTPDGTAAGKEGQGKPTTQIAKRVAGGEAEMGHSFADTVGGLDHGFWAFEVPYLMRDYRHMEGVFEGPLGNGMLEGLRSHQLVGLSFTYSGGASGVASVGRELRKPGDLKGLKVGVYGDPVNEAWLKSLGATPVAIEHWEERILNLERDGALDAVVITWRNFEREKLKQRFKHMNLMGSTYLVSVTYINESFYASLPEAYRTLLKTASHEAGRLERAKTIELNERARRALMAKGVRSVHATEADKRAFAEALAPVNARVITPLVGKDLVEKIKKTKDGAVHPSMPSDFAQR